jgi:hypothetical protein
MSTRKFRSADASPSSPCIRGRGSAAALDLAARLSWLIRWCKPVRFGRLTPYAWLSQCRRGAT